MQYRWPWLDILHDVFHCAGRKMQLMWHMHRMGNRRCNSKLSFVSFLQSARRNRLRRQRNPWIFDKSCFVFCLTFLALEYWFEKKTCCYFDIVFFFFMWKHHREAECVSFAAGGSLLRIAPSFVFIRLSDFSRGRGLLRSLFANHFSLFCLLVFTSRRYLLYVHYYTRWSKCTTDGRLMYGLSRSLWLFASFCFSSFCTLRARWRFQKKPWHKKKTIWTWVLRRNEKTLPAHDTFVWRRQLDVDFSETMI